MPIHDQSYRRYAGPRRPPGQTWGVIARAGIKTMIRRRAFLGLLLLAWAPFFVRAVQIYIATNFPQASMFAPTAETFREFLDQQGTFVFFVTIFVGAGLIANDRRANALQIYLSKPLARTEYIAGKLAVLLTFLLLVTFAPAMLLLLVQIVFAGSFAFARAHLFLFPAITLYSLLEALLGSFTMLALSSLSTSSRYVGILYAGAVLFSDGMAEAFRGITGSSRAAWISYPNNLEQLGDVIFRLRPRFDMPWPVAFVVVVATLTLSISVLERRVRGVEVVT